MLATLERKRSGNVTLKQVAEECGVTAQTVSRVLNSDKASLYRSETRDLVKRAAEAMGYRPNASARTIRTGRFGCVSLLVSRESYSSFMPQELTVSAYSRLNSLGYNLLFNVLPADGAEARKELPRIFRENIVDGALVGITQAIPPWLGSLIDSMRVPLIWIGSKQTCNCIHHDDYGSARSITERLVLGGHRDIAYVDLSIPHSILPVSHFSVADRMGGYQAAMSEAGLRPRVIRPECPLDPMDYVKYLEEHLLGGTRPSAVLTYDLGNSCRPLLFALCRNGLKVPDDVSIVSYNESPVWENGAQIACFAPKMKEVGELAALMLDNRIKADGANQAPRILDFELNLGTSVAGIAAG